MQARVLVAAVLATTILAGSAGARGEPEANAATPCPAGVLPLTKDAVALAIAAAVRAEEKEDADAMVTSAKLASYDRSPRAAQIVKLCGRKASQR